MTGLDLVSSTQWSLGALFGSSHPFFIINAATVINTWIVLGIIALVSLLARYFIPLKGSLVRHLVLSFVRTFMNMCSQSMGGFYFTHFCFVTTVFVFILLCNTLSIFPYLEEPTTDLNTPVCIGLIAFIYTQIAAISSTGLWAYIKGYFEPFFPMLPLNIVGKLASVLSISFRLFGNIFGGAIITSIYGQAIRSSLASQLIGLFFGLNLCMTLFFTLFEGFLQAFVFCMLVLTYLSMALQGEGGH